MHALSHRGGGVYCLKMTHGNAAYYLLAWMCRSSIPTPWSIGHTVAHSSRPLRRQARTKTDRDSDS